RVRDAGAAQGDVAFAPHRTAGTADRPAGNRSVDAVLRGPARAARPRRVAPDGPRGASRLGADRARRQCIGLAAVSRLRNRSLVGAARVGSRPMRKGFLLALAATLLLVPAPARGADGCPKGATCGRVTVPLDHTGVTPGTLSIAYSRVPA